MKNPITDFQYQGIASVSKWTIFVTALKLSMVAALFIAALVARWVEVRISAVRSRLLNVLWRKRNG
jgi:hypothetical protein